MAFSPPSDAMAVDEPPPKPDSAPTSHGSPSLEEEEDVWVIDPPPPKHDSAPASGGHWSAAEVEQMKSSLDCPNTLFKMCRKYGINEEKYRPFCPEDGWGPCKTPPEGSVCVYKVMLEVGVRFPMHDFYTKILRHYRIAPSQLTPNAWRYLAGFILVCDGAGVKPTVPIFRHYFKLTAASGSKLQGWYSFVHYRRLFSPAENHRTHDGWKKLFFLLESRSVETAWCCPTKWGTPSQDSHKAPVLDAAATEAIKKLEARSGKSLQSMLSKCDKLPVLPTLERAPVKEEADNSGAFARPISPPRKYRAMSSIIMDHPPQQLAVATGMASSSSPAPELVTTPEPDPDERPVRADSRDRDRQHSASQAMRRTEEDLHRVEDELRQEKSKRAADVAQLNRELGAAKAEHTAQVAKISAEKAESDATVRQLMEELRTEKTMASQLAEDFRGAEAKHVAEVKALSDEWQLKVTHAKRQSGAIIGAALRETCSAVLKTIQDRLVASYPCIEPAIETPPPGFPPHQALQEPVIPVAFHKTIKEEVEARQGTERRIQDLMMTRCPSIDPAILTLEALLTAPEHQ